MKFACCDRSQLSTFHVLLSVSLSIYAFHKFSFIFDIFTSLVNPKLLIRRAWNYWSEIGVN